MIKKISILLMLFILSISISSATTVTYLPGVSQETTVSYSNNIQSEYRLLDESDRMTSVLFVLDNGGYTQNTGLLVNFDNNVTYKLKTDKYYYLGIIPMIDITTTVYLQNYTVVNYTHSRDNIIPVDIKLYIRRPEINTSILTTPRAGIAVTFDYTTDKYIGLPSSGFVATALSPFEVEITYTDIVAKTELSSLSNIIYQVVKVGCDALGIIGIHLDTSGFYDLLLMLDTMFSFIGLVFQAFYTYPQLILVWLLIMGNMAVAWQATTLREILFCYSDYLTWVVKSVSTVFKYIWDAIIKLIQAISTAL